jgi:hypothetical protein
MSYREIYRRPEIMNGPAILGVVLTSVFGLAFVGFGLQLLLMGGPATAPGTSIMLAGGLAVAAVPFLLFGEWMRRQGFASNPEKSMEGTVTGVRWIAGRYTRHASLEIRLVDSNNFEHSMRFVGAGVSKGDVEALRKTGTPVKLWYVQSGSGKVEPLRAEADV